MPALLHVSDVHFGPRHLPELARALGDLVAAERPATVVVSGDLTQRAKPRQFREARRWLDALAAPAVYVPGNHDVPMYRFWERLLAPFGAWRGHLDAELVRGYRGAGLAILGVNTAFAWTRKHGRLGRGELERLGGELAALPAGGLRVLVAHHPLAGTAELRGEPVARGAAAALDLCRRHGVELVLSGHLHRSFWLRAPRTELGEGPFVAHCGTSASSRGRGEERGRNSLHWIEFDAATIRLERRFWDPGARAFLAGARIELPRG